MTKTIGEKAKTARVVLDREQLLGALEYVRPALAEKGETVEQSSCLCFRQGLVFAYNDEACCRGPSGLPDAFEFAVSAGKLLDLLRRLDDETVRVSLEGGQLRVGGKGKLTGFDVESSVRLPLDSVALPDEWRPLPADFGEALSKVKACADKDEANFRLTCVNVNPDWVEACDSFQACRWTTATGFLIPVLIKASSASAVAALGASECGETDDWVHFRNARGFVLSCRRYREDYPSATLTRMFALKGEKITLPKGLKEASERANLFSSETTEQNLVEVSLEVGRLTVTGQGAGGFHRESRAASWAGRPLRFLIPPDLLGELVKTYNEVSLSERVLSVHGGSYVYCTNLTLPLAEKEPAGHGEEDEEGDEA